ncbi:MAG: exodeoxyribonuclease III [Bacteroidetes bacterium MED-G17]|nr:MAG: exodeoxyribonuclease III [Bacteroidetes bacterium MED-G17]|tara:strand:- start:1774 stop:2541 length:768 start_codon:yes stop_codon:yes gene_type:complete
MKILTYNINGIRAALKKNLLGFLEEENPDIVCLQETKAQPDQIDDSLFEHLGYSCYWKSAEKKGYSGVGILTKRTPKELIYECKHSLFDSEGRILQMKFDNFTVLSAYFPSGSSGDFRQQVKYDFLDFFMEYQTALKKDHPNLIVCGDFNICHQSIDIHNPIGNKNSSGFLPEERAWMDKYFSSGNIDSFRHFHPDEQNHYTWWSYRANARKNNKGWRIDYISVSDSLDAKIKGAKILSKAMHSDHCPSYIELDM